MKNRLRSVILILAVSGTLGCSTLSSAKPREGYTPGPTLLATSDPLAPKRAFPAWNPPKQFAVWVHPHPDPAQGILLGGQWVLENLTAGGWYTQEFEEQDPVPSKEATPADVERARTAIGPLTEFVVPYRVKD